MRIGTAGWTIPRAVRHEFAETGSQLERYAQRFSCVEINSTFYRPHRAATFERWASSVPDDFRFSVKLPKTITHERRLVGVEDLVARFLDETSALGVKREVVLVQLPPSFAFDPRVVRPFFELVRRAYAGRLVCEPRHATWFERAADTMLEEFAVGRVAADPSLAGVPLEPGGCREMAYWRMHGSPRTYYSSYNDATLTDLSERLVRASKQSVVWCIFDNTASGAAAGNALVVNKLVLQG